MAAQMDKAMAFLREFETTAEFLAYCEGQGIRGVRYDASRCLVAQALKGVLGVPSAIHCGGTVTLDNGPARAMPGPIFDALVAFDAGAFPHLEAE